MPQKRKKNSGRFASLKKLWRSAVGRLIGFLPTKAQFRHLPKLLSNRERFVVLALGLTALLALAAGPIGLYYHYTTPVADSGGSFSEGMVGAPKYINPLLAQTSDVDRDLSELIYAGLMRFDDSGVITYGLAKSFDISADGLIYTFKLKDNLRWHDGQPLTADDVIFTILTAQNADYGSFQRINWQGVEATKIDGQTVAFKLRNKYAQFLGNTTIGILPKHLWESIKPSGFGLSELNIKPIGAGPYSFSKVRKDGSGNITNFTVTAFENYFAGRPNIAKINFVFYLSEDKMIEGFNQNEIDGLSFISPQKLNAIRFLGRLNIRELKLPRYFAVFFNQNQSLQFSDKSVRLALNYATDKKELLDKILDNKGSAVDSPMLPGIINLPAVTAKYDFDIEKAKKILDEAGWKYSETDKIREKIPAPVKTKTKETSQPIRLAVRLTTSNWPELVVAANQLKAQWEKIGAAVRVEILALPELQQAIKERSYEALLFGEVLGLEPDPFSFWHSSQKKDPGLNLALYDNPEADKILEDTRQILDTAARLNKYADFQKMVVADAPVVFLYSPDYLYGLPGKVKANGTAVIAVPSDRFDSVNKWYIETKRVLRK